MATCSAAMDPEQGNVAPTRNTPLSWLRPRALARLAIAALATITLVGWTGKHTGGGFLDSATGDGSKATFGLNLQGHDDDGNGYSDRWTGQLQYHDHGADVRAHAVVDRGSTGITFDEDGNPRFFSIYRGDYTPQPRNLGPGGSFVCIVFDGSEPGLDSGDTMVIAFRGGVYGGYLNSGPIQGGNIQWHPAE